MGHNVNIWLWVTVTILKKEPWETKESQFWKRSPGRRRSAETKLANPATHRWFMGIKTKQMHSTEDTNTKGRLLSSLIHPCTLLTICSGNLGITLSAGRARLLAPKPAEQAASLWPSLEVPVASWCSSHHCEAQLVIWQNCLSTFTIIAAQKEGGSELGDTDGLIWMTQLKLKGHTHIKTKTTCLPKLPSYTELEFSSKSEHNETITQIYISYSIYFILKECWKNLMTNHFLFLANTF